MKQVIAILIKSKRLDILRKKYHSPFKKQPTHITLVYRFEVKDQEKLTKHIEHCLRGIKPFEITLQKIRKSSNYLVLDVVRNRLLLLDIYKKLNSGILAGFKNKELSIYLPHVTLGLFKTVPELLGAINHLRGQNLDFRVDVEGISLLTVNDDEDGSVKSKIDFKLK